MIFTINAILPLFLLIVFGKLLKNLKVYDDLFVERTNKLLFSMLLPVLVFKSIYVSGYQKEFNLKLVLINMVMLIATALISWFIVPFFEKDNRRKGVIIQSLFRNNYVLIGIPLCRNLFGDEYLGIITMILAFYVPAMNLLAVIVLSYYSEQGSRSIGECLMDIIKNPFVISTSTAIIISTLQIKFPYAVEVVLDDTSTIANPLALLVLGGSLNFDSMNKYAKYIISISAIKLLVLPAVILIICIFLGMRGIELVIMLSMFGSSTGIASHSMALHMKSDHILAGVIVASTIVFSSITLFLFILTMKTINVI